MARARGSRWQADVRTPEGARLRPAFKSKGEAEAWEREARDSIADGRPIPEPGTSTAGKRDLSLLGPLFDHVVKTHWTGMRSEEGLIRNGKEVVEYFGRKKPVVEIEPADVDEFIASLAAQGRSHATINRKLSALSKMLTIGHRNGAVDAKPFINWRREDKTRFRYLDAEEERAMLAYWKSVGDGDQHDLCMFLLDTGSRAFSEAIPMTWKDCDGRAATFWNTKTNAPRTVPLTHRCREMLARRKKLRPSSRGPFQGFNKNTMRDRWDAMRRTLPGFEDVTPHVMRHTCLTRLALGGADVKRIMEWAGHSDVTVTMRYLQLRPRSLEDILHILEPAEPA